MTIAQPRFKSGESIHIPFKSLGHDSHKVSRRYTVSKVYPSTTPHPKDNSYTIKGLGGIWPETRLSK